MIGDVNKKTKEELLDVFAKKTDHNTLEGEQYIAALIVKSASDLEQCAKDFGEQITALAQVAGEINISLVDFKNIIKKSNENSDKLSQKLFWLNVVLTAATVVGAITTVILALK